MPLKKSIGNMYPWVTHTHVHLGGKCPHECSYCYVDNPRYGRPKRYQGELRLLENEFKVNYGEGRTIFVENCNDLFAEDVPEDFIQRIIGHCLDWPKNIYVFQTKNPARVLNWVDFLPEKSMIGTTIETNRKIEGSKAPDPKLRYQAMKKLKFKKFVTIEPIMDFDVKTLLEWIVGIKPDFINIGADSKRKGLVEPSPEKVKMLILKLGEANVEIKKKHNLDRLLK